MQEKIIDTFKALSKPFQDKIGGPKLDELTKRLMDIGVDFEWIPGTGVIVNQQEKPKKVIVSHMDLIKKFQKGFAEEKICEIKKETIIGALDNTITNAVLLLIIEKMYKEGTIADIEFLFSEGEEVGFVGVRNYFKDHKKRVKKSFFINLDVTNEGYKQSASIEYDKCNFNCLKLIQGIEAEKEHSFFYTSDRVCDDTDEIISNNCHGFSYCLPTKDLIHSYKNKARLDSLEPYLNGLYDLIVLDHEHFIGAKDDVTKWHFEKVLTMATYEEYVEYKEKNKPAFSGGSGFYSGGRDYEFSYLNDLNPDIFGPTKKSDHEDFWGTSSTRSQSKRPAIQKSEKMSDKEKELVALEIYHVIQNKCTWYEDIEGKEEATILDQIIQLATETKFLNLNSVIALIGFKKAKFMIDKLVDHDIFCWISSSIYFLGNVEFTRNDQIMLDFLELPSVTDQLDDCKIEFMIPFMKSMYDIINSDKKHFYDKDIRDSLILNTEWLTEAVSTDLIELYPKAEGKYSIYKY